MAGLSVRRGNSAKAPTAAVAPGRLVATKLILGLFALALCALSIGQQFVGTRNDLWPVVTWHMYHARTPEVPPPLVTATHIRVTDRGGRPHLLRPTELMPAPRDAAAEELIRRAFSSSTRDRRSHREHLVFLIERALENVDVAAVEALKRTWRVDPYATPPLDRSAPVREVVRGRFVESASNRTGSAP